MTSTKNNSNPFKEAPLLPMLEELVKGEIDTKPKFNRWKSSFKNQFDKFLTTQDGSSKAAETAYAVFHKQVVKLSNTFNKIEDYIQQGEGALMKVGAQRCLADLKACTTVAVDGLADLLPGSGLAEKTREAGYTNYHMGAVLIGDGFSLYAYLDNCDQILMDYKDNQLRSVDKQILDELDNYHKKLGAFCDIMADLGLYETMLKTREILENDEDETVATEPESDISVGSESSTKTEEPVKAEKPAPAPRRRKTKGRVKKPNLPASIPRNSIRGQIPRNSMRGGSLPRNSLRGASDHSARNSTGRRPSVAPPKVMRTLIPIDPSSLPQGGGKVFSMDAVSDQIWKNGPTEDTPANNNTSNQPAPKPEIKKTSSLKAALNNPKAPSAPKDVGRLSLTEHKPKPSLPRAVPPRRSMSSLTPDPAPEPKRTSMPPKRAKSLSASEHIVRPKTSLAPEKKKATTAASPASSYIIPSNLKNPMEMPDSDEESSDPSMSFAEDDDADDDLVTASPREHIVRPNANPETEKKKVPRVSSLKSALNNPKAPATPKDVGRLSLTEHKPKPVLPRAVPPRRSMSSLTPEPTPEPKRTSMPPKRAKSLSASEHIVRPKTNLAPEKKKAATVASPASSYIIPPNLKNPMEMPDEESSDPSMSFAEDDDADLLTASAKAKQPKEATKPEEAEDPKPKEEEKPKSKGWTSKAKSFFKAPTKASTSPEKPSPNAPAPTNGASDNAPSKARPSPSMSVPKKEDPKPAPTKAKPSPRISVPKKEDPEPNSNEPNRAAPTVRQRRDSLLKSCGSIGLLVPEDKPNKPSAPKKNPAEDPISLPETATASPKEEEAAPESKSNGSGKKYVLTITLDETLEGPKPRMVVIGHGDGEMGENLQANIVMKRAMQALKNPEDFDLSYFMNVGK